MNITIKDIVLDISGTKILKNINMDIQKKQIIGIIGPNGSGKSTLLKCIYRVLEPNNGAIFLNDFPLKNLSYKISAQSLAVVEQHNSYNFEFTVNDIVMMGRSPHKKFMEQNNEEDVKIVNNAISMVNMEGYENRIFSTLSGGEKQRIILARAIAQNTPCLILDEPTNHLDIKYQLQLLQIIKNLDITIVAAFHDLSIAANHCDYIYTLKNGKLTHHGEPKKLFTKEFIQEVYGVNSSILTDNYGNVVISYHF